MKYSTLAAAAVAALLSGASVASADVYYDYVDTNRGVSFEYEAPGFNYSISNPPYLSGPSAGGNIVYCNNCAFVNIHETGGLGNVYTNPYADNSGRANSVAYFYSPWVSNDDNTRATELASFGTFSADAGDGIAGPDGLAVPPGGITLTISGYALPQSMTAPSKDFISNWYNFIAAAKNGPTEQQMLNAELACIDQPNCDIGALAKANQAINLNILALGHAAGVSSIGLVLGTPSQSLDDLALSLAISAPSEIQNTISLYDILADRQVATDAVGGVNSFSAIETPLEEDGVAGELVTLDYNIAVLDSELDALNDSAFYVPFIFEGQSYDGIGTVISAVDPPGWGQVTYELQAFVPSATSQATVPEPITITLFGAGLLGAFASRRRKTPRQAG